MAVVRCITSLLLLCAPLSPLFAQPVLPNADERVRLRAPDIVSGRFTGTVTGRTPDTLYVRGDEGLARALPIRAISSLERSRGRSQSAGALKGMRRGTLIGLGLALVNLGFSDRACDEETGECFSVASSIAVWTGLGFGLGLVIGSARGSERWERVPLRVAIAPHRGGTLAVSLGWAPRGGGAP